MVVATDIMVQTMMMAIMAVLMIMGDGDDGCDIGDYVDDNNNDNEN